MISRLVSLGSVLVDMVLEVPRLPERGGDVLAQRRVTAAGGAFNVMSAAARLGLRSAYAGPHGTGMFGELVRDTLAREGIELLCAANPDLDTGWTVALIEPDGERTFVTVTGADGIVTRQALAGVACATGDALYVSGYDLAYPRAGEAIAEYVRELAAGVFVAFDPGPLAGEIDPSRLDTVLRRCSVTSLNQREMEILGGADRLLAFGTALVVRLGARGAEVLQAGRDPVQVPAHPVERVVDTSGAGDVHVGATLAGLARGLELVEAVGLANAAAAYAVSRHGPAAGPTEAELRDFTARRI